jgi:dTDP-4-dehydrorhamnose reductase
VPAFKHNRIAIIGASGQLGTELVRVLADRAIPLRHSQIEVSDASNIRAALDATNPDFVINAAAYNWVDKAEDEPHVAYAINALGPRNLALACAERSIPLLHVSSDYVFGLGSSDLPATTQTTTQLPYRETDLPGPLSAYGLSKLAGEYFVRALCPQHYVIRTCGLYGNAEAVGKGNFVKTMLRLGRERGHVRVVSDQHCTPTSVEDLAAALLQLIETDAYGLYHLTNQGATTWFDFAREIFRVAGLSVTTDPITTREFGAKAQRPPYSVLNCEKASTEASITMPSWQEAVARYVQSLPQVSIRKSLRR